MCLNLKTPAFWYDTQSPLARAAAGVLSPLSILYETGYRIHQNKRKGVLKSPVPIICIGNLTAGGSGKTPTALAVLSFLKRQGIVKNPVFLTHGYGGKLATPAIVDPARHTAADVGDEALLLVRTGPVIVSRNRPLGIQLAEKQNFDLVIMDDGLQNPSVVKTLSLVVIDGATGFGNGRLLPAGPLREPLEEGLIHADAFILIGEDKRNTTALLPAGTPVFKASLTVPAEYKSSPGIRYAAFAGIGYPEKFRRTLEDCGATIASWHPFPDHHRYTQRDLQMLARAAEKHQARLITTEKDFVRLPAAFVSRHKVGALPVRLTWEDDSQIERFIKDRL